MPTFFYDKSTRTKRHRIDCAFSLSGTGGRSQASNLTIAEENVTASESTLRDADMAKEMTAYTKANILSQTAQSMLAQANQNASGILSLLQ